MQAIRFERFGPPEVLRLQEVEPPRPRRNQALVRVRAAAVNPKDIIVRSGKFRILTGRRFPMPAGYDFSGEIVEAPQGSELQPGRAVFGMLNGWRGGTYGQYVAAPLDELAARPASLSWTEAASLPLAGQTALQALRDRGSVQPGHEVLINGASGGVGTLAIQIARALGARVTAVSSARNKALCSSLGAAEHVAYDELEITSLDRKFDVFFDVFGNQRFDAVRRLLESRGRYIQTVPGPRNFIQSFVHRFSAQRPYLVIVRSRRSDLEFLASLVEQGQLKPVIDRVLPLAEATEAHRHVQTKRAQGKVVLEMPKKGSGLDT